MFAFDSIDPDSLVRLCAALLAAGAIGIERDWRRMPTGFRTLGLVGLGSCAAVIAALKAGDTDGFSRVAQGVVTGIGFLGAGVIVQGQRVRDVKGLTTAAAIWLSASIGLLCGAGHFMLAFATATLALIVLLADAVIDPGKNDRERADSGTDTDNRPKGAKKPRAP